MSQYNHHVKRLQHGVNSFDSHTDQMKHSQSVKEFPLLKKKND